MASHKLVCLADFEKQARETLPRSALDYYRSGANEEVSLQDNINAFKRFKLMPRFLTDVSQRDLTTTILGHRLAFPVCVAPTAMQRMAHPEGEVANARACQAMKVGFTLSTIATSSLEEIAQGAPDVLRFFQVYIYRERDITRQLVKRAETCGFNALVLTVDTPFFGTRWADNRNKFTLPPHLKMANFEGLNRKPMAESVSKSKEVSGLNEYASSLFDPSLTWKDVAWLKSITHLPIVVKGILTAADADKACEAGVSGIIVSNHGARQLDTVPATINVLGEIVHAVNGRCEVYLDGGVRTGTDVLKAIALGARAVFIGRPAVYGLACNGAEGVKQVLQILRSEFDTAMALSGCSCLLDINRELVRHESCIPSRL